VYVLQLHGSFSYLNIGSSEKYSLYSLAVALQGSGLDNVIFESQQKQEIYLLLQNVLTGWWVHSACYSVSTGGFFSEVKWSECETYNSLLSSCEVKNESSYTLPSSVCFMCVLRQFCLVVSHLFYLHLQIF
jgi:hypothetical protein